MVTVSTAASKTTNCALFPHTLCICVFVWFSELTEIIRIALYGVTWLVFLVEYVFPVRYELYRVTTQLQ